MEIKNKEWFPIAVLTIFCLIMFFAFAGSYPLIDVDETRYVRIAQEMLISNNFLTPMINGEIFLEKPPLFFWLEDISFALFGVSEWTARLPMAIVASFGVFMTYYFGQKLVSKRFGLISALVLGSSVIYIVLSHIAILDLLLSVTMMVSVYFGILTLYSLGRENWLQWSGFYIFCALSALSKGLPGIIIPFGVVFLAYLFSKRLKDLFDFKKIGLGLLLLLIIFLPWHIMMYKAHGQAFINEYILKHHFARFVNSAGINRKEPFWFFVPVILIGFLPFAATLISSFTGEIKKCADSFKTGFNLDIFRYFSPDITMIRRFLSINILAFLFIFCLFSCASTKLPTYILPAIFPLSFITGYIFDEYFENNKFELPIKVSNIIMSLIFLVVAIFGVIVFLFPARLGLENVIGIKPVALCGIFLFGSYSLYNIIKLIQKTSQTPFIISTVIMMAILTVVANLRVYNLIVDFGQNELIEYAKYAKNNNKKLATFDFGHRYSVIYYFGKHVDINETPDYKWLDSKLNEDYFVILKNKNMIIMPSETKFEVIKSGKKYSLVKKDNQGK